MVSSREEAIELLLTMSDITKEIAELMKGEAATPPAEEKKELSLEEVRAELSKLSRAGKTAVGEYPVEVIRYLRKTADMV